MSHIREADCDITDVELFSACVNELMQEFIKQYPEIKQTMNVNDTTVRLLKNTCPRYFSGKGPECDYVVFIPGSSYDLGFKLDQKTGKYKMVADSELFVDSPYWKNSTRFFAGKMLGADLRNALERYYIRGFEREAEERGYTVSFYENEAGELIGNVDIPETEDVYSSLRSA